MEVKALGAIPESYLQQALVILKSHFGKQSGMELLNALVFGKVKSSASGLQNFARGGRLITSSSSDEMKNLHLALALLESDVEGGEATVVGVAAVSKVVKDPRRDQTFNCAVIMLFGVSKDLQGQGIGSKLLGAINKWVVTIAQPHEPGERLSGQLLVLSAGRAQRRPGRNPNWWLRRLEDERTPWKVYEDRSRLINGIGSNGSLAAGLWVPWGMGVEGGVVVVAVEVAAIAKRLPSPVEISSTDEEEREEEAAAPQFPYRWPLMFETCCGSRRLANEMAKFQWHTLSCDHGEKGIPHETPRCWDDPDKEANLVIIRPHEVHQGLFLPNGRPPTKPLHFHINGRFEEISPDALPTLTFLHGSPDCQSRSSMSASHHPLDEEHEHVAVNEGATLPSVEWDKVVNHFRDVVRNQKWRQMRDERLNEGFTFSLEQPGERARVRGHRTIKLLMQPLANGGENAVIVPVDICQFGAPSRKRTDLITDCGEVVETLTRKEEDGSRTPMYLCKGVSSSHKHIGVKGRARQSTPFCHGLVSTLAMAINRQSKHRKAVL